MDRENVKNLLKDVLGPNVPLVDQPEWVSIRCPFAPWKHAKGVDLKPSAGVSVHPDGESVFRCFTCHTAGALPYFLRHLSEFTGEDYRELADDIEHGEVFSGTLPEWGRRAPTALSATQTPLDEALYFSLYDSAVGHPYLASRGVSGEAAATMRLMVDPADSDGDERILFPVFDTQKRLVGFSGRAVRAEAALKVRDYHGFRKKLNLLGIHLALEAPYLILVEGLVDYARMVHYGLPGVAFMSSTVTPEQVAILRRAGKPVFFFHDNDTAGIDARERACEALCRYLPFMEVSYPSDQTVILSDGSRRAPEDPAELNRAQILRMLSDAEPR